jgi:hypothetical protein
VNGLVGGGPFLVKENFSTMFLDFPSKALVIANICEVPEFLSCIFGILEKLLSMES